MELKHREKTMLYLWRNRLNCTVMELKQSSAQELSKYTES